MNIASFFFSPGSHPDIHCCNFTLQHIYTVWNHWSVKIMQYLKFWWGQDTHTHKHTHMHTPLHPSKHFRLFFFIVITACVQKEVRCRRNKWQMSVRSETLRKVRETSHRKPPFSSQLNHCHKVIQSYSLILGGTMGIFLLLWLSRLTCRGYTCIIMQPSLCKCWEVFLWLVW